jgi:hypothetical protein
MRRKISHMSEAKHRSNEVYDIEVVTDVFETRVQGGDKDKFLVVFSLDRRKTTTCTNSSTNCLT